jgi:hypothetical protein
MPDDDDEVEDEMTPEQLAELDSALEEADRGEGISGEEMLRQMRELRERLTS